MKINHHVQASGHFVIISTDEFCMSPHTENGTPSEVLLHALDYEEKAQFCMKQAVRIRAAVVLMEQAK